jgi:hypothetical protein
MKYEDDHMIFATGKRRYAHAGIIGLTCSYEVTEGYDGNFWMVGEAEDEALTPAERVELADYMLERWQTFRDMAFASKL